MPAGEPAAALRLAAGGLPGLRADGGHAAPHLPPLRQDLGGPRRRTRPHRFKRGGCCNDGPALETEEKDRVVRS